MSSGARDATSLSLAMPPSRCTASTMLGFRSKLDASTAASWIANGGGVADLAAGSRAHSKAGRPVARPPPLECQASNSNGTGRESRAPALPKGALGHAVLLGDHVRRSEQCEQARQHRLLPLPRPVVGRQRAESGERPAQQLRVLATLSYLDQLLVATGRKDFEPRVVGGGRKECELL